MEASSALDESRVLVIYTGGTIGMLVGQQGYVPEPTFLTETLQSQNRFHDPLQDSLFSNASSVQGFREWTRNGRSSPQPLPPGDISFASPISPTLLVRSSRPISYETALNPSLNDTKNDPRCIQVADNMYEAHLPTLVTPRSKVPGGTTSKAIRYAILEWNPLLDSSNMAIEDWIRIATEIEFNYATFDAFVILHGTDTMAYTSSALSFLLEDLGKTVILTGAQIPLSQLRNDAVDNLMGALTIAGHYIIPECCLYFNHTLFRGNRVTKMSSYDLSAFNSPNFPPLVNVGIDIVVNWNDVIRQTSLRKFRAYKEMNPHVATLRLFPGISGQTIRAFCMSPIRGVVLETFGAGNAPQREDVMAALKEACDRGVVVVAISQCAKGSVSDAYETGRTLLQAGVVPGSDMTPECALAKLSYLLSKTELSLKEVRDLIGSPLRGELTRPSGGIMQNPAIDQNLENIQHLLAQFIRLSQPPSIVPVINITAPDAVQPTAQDAAAPWSWTAAEAATAEAVLFPFLIHLAAAKDDIESLEYCLKLAGSDDAAEMLKFGMIPGGFVNCLEVGSGRSPLHMAALNGNTRAVELLLRSGALVHLRDTLGHTALYLAARQGHEAVVDILIQAGATLAGADLHFVPYGLRELDTLRPNDKRPLHIWLKAGWKPS
ncbi:asparaginase-domain-containing protein [Gymnopilus junonius]|uniref:asparaginase n=1 Tax=Gymnopilus junonius TaxID=109634 RepID=A0A9P5P1D0_GYMJU|nr:asparaginase-domain-containing protein [Gymnopilus junonius]